MWTVFPALMSHRVATMRSLSNASGQEERAKNMSEWIVPAADLWDKPRLFGASWPAYLGGRSWTVLWAPWLSAPGWGPGRSSPGSGWPPAACGGRFRSGRAVPWSCCKLTTSSTRTSKTSVMITQTLGHVAWKQLDVSVEMKCFS